MPRVIHWPGTFENSHYCHRLICPHIYLVMWQNSVRGNEGVVMRIVTEPTDIRFDGACRNQF